MRHKNTVVKLSRKAGPRKALLRGLVTSFVLKGKIHTTMAKAKALRPIAERLITFSRQNTLAVRRRLLGYLYDEKAVKKLLEDLGPAYANRKGGYTRIIRLAERKGDNAPLAVIELV